MCLSGTPSEFLQGPSTCKCLAVMGKEGAPQLMSSGNRSPPLLHELPLHWPAALAPSPRLTQSPSPSHPHHPPSPPVLQPLLWRRDLSGEPLAALLITGELTGWVGEMCIFSRGEEKGDQERRFSVGTFSVLSPELSGFPGSWICKISEWERARERYGKGWRERRKMVNTAVRTLVWERFTKQWNAFTVQCWKANKKQTQKRRDANSLWHCDGPLVETDSPSAGKDYFTCPLSWEPHFANILIPKLAHLSTYWFIWRQIGVEKQLAARILQGWRGWRKGGWSGWWWSCPAPGPWGLGVETHSDLPLQNLLIFPMTQGDWKNSPHSAETEADAAVEWQR